MNIEKNNKKTKSTHAMVASIIRKKLKAKFPKIKFRVRSECFAMGDAVRVDWVDGPKSSEIQKITQKYEDDNNPRSNTTVKYIQLNREMGVKIHEELTQAYNKRFEIKEEKYDYDRWRYIYRQFEQLDF